ncbi:DNA-directed RNA polymerase subunit alpha [Patescibacteria group bacterium]|nr:DNA-directed RNA polymerase subunit alpha [Patescibacteria group bacterium]
MILLPKQPKIISKKENWARFEIEALYPGYGVTIGNSLRRVLLSSLPGVAVTQTKIKGIQHEFSVIPGVLEDVITIVMNLKQLRFKMYTDEPQKVTLKIKGEKKVKGSDFKFPSQVELVNKSCYLATLTNKKAELGMEIQVERGVGYEPVERRKKQGKLEVGVISIDAIFTPVKRVSYKVENMRVGERTDFDRLYLDIETDGTVTPEEAFFQASEILVKHFSLFAEISKALAGKRVSEEKAPKKKPVLAKRGPTAAKKKQKESKKKSKKPASAKKASAVGSTKSARKKSK